MIFRELWIILVYIIRTITIKVSIRDSNKRVSIYAMRIIERKSTRCMVNRKIIKKIV